ncbi:MAG: PAS domain S-box protein [Ignavibacteriales bacterium]|nr:Sensor histidine kinase RcsC [Ignavibacteriaceae bacterium]QOJ30353.1 MAG: PAS domain S-box protein [Ignavibacteriales bacterium]
MTATGNTGIFKRYPLIIPVSIFAVFALTITIAAFYYYFSIRREVENSYGNTLSSITKLKIRQIQNYNSERLSDARYLFKNAGFSAAMHRFLQNPGGEAEINDIHAWLDQLQKNHNYKIIQVINNRKDVIFATGLRGGLSTEAPVPRNHSFDGMYTPSFIDLHLNKSREYIHMQTYVPVYYGGDKPSDIIGGVLFTIDPFTTFYPLIAESPLPTETGESILVRLEQDSVVYISPLRFFSGNPFEVSVSRSDTSRAVVKVAKGLGTYGSGLDYRGTEILFYGEMVPDRNWMIITKMDIDEVYSGIRATSILIFLLLSALIAISGGALYIFTKQQNLRSLQYQAESAIAVAQLNRLYELISLVNTAIARDTSKKELLKTITSISVDKGGYSYSVITLSESEGGQPVITSYSGRNPVLPSKEQIIYDLIAAANLLTGQDQKTVIVNNVRQTSLPESSLRLFEANNICALAFFPLHPGGKNSGGFYLFSENCDQFSMQETALLEELASDVSFGLHSISEHEKIQLSEQIIKDSELRYRNLIENSPDAILINHRNKIILVNKAAVKLFKAAHENDLVGRSPLSLFAGNYKESIADRIRFMRDTGLTVQPAEEQIRCLDGSSAYVEVVAAPYKIGEELAIHVILRDITGRKKQEEKLRESEERLRLSLEAANQGIYDLDMITGEAIVNDQYATMLGYDPSEFRETNDAWIERMHPDDREHTSKAYLDYIGGKIPEYRMEFRQKTADGSYKWILSLGKVIERDENGKPLRMLGTHTDIHKQKEAEYQLLLQSRMLNQAGQIITAVSTRGRIVFWNNKAESELGWSSEEVKGKNLLDILVPEYEQPDLRQIIRNAASGKSWDGQLLLMRKDGTVFTAEILISPYYSGTGELLGLIALGQDVTQKLEDQQKIRNLSRAVEQSPASIVITKTNGTIVYVNNKVTEVTGYTGAELIGNNPRILSSNEMKPEAYKQMYDTILAGNEWHGEFHNRKKNGELYWEAASISPLRNEKGEIVYFLAVKEDITEQKKLIEELIEARDRTEESNRTKTNFLANMSHELRTPLIAILGFSDILLENENDEEKIEFLRSIYSGGERLLQTVNALLHFSNLHEAGLMLTPVEFDIEEICSEIVENYRIKAVKKGLQFIHRCEGSKKIVTDKLLLADALGYILDNAVRFTREGSIELTMTSTPELFTFAVRDTGIGIPQDKIRLIFEEFRQVSEGLSRQYEGSGLGLTLASKYIQILGGHIEVDSRVGEGSEFRIILPVKPEQN